MRNRGWPSWRTEHSVTPAALSTGFDALLVDLDGTLIRGTEVIPGAAHSLAVSGLPVIYVTNNASRAPSETAAHLAGMGFAVTASEVMTSAQAAVVMLADHVEPGAAVLVVGHDSFRALVSEAGYRVVTSADDAPDAVVQGLSRELTWADLAEGCLAIRRGVPWIASNVDTTLPTERGLLPGNGSLVAALRAATDRAPLVAGKPAPGVLRAAADQAGSSSPLVIGDRLDTDIEGAVAAGMPALLVLTGVNGAMDLLQAPPHRRATHLGEGLGSLAEPDESSRISSAPEPDCHIVDRKLMITELPAGSAGTDLARGVIRAAWRHEVTTLVTDDPSVRSRLAGAGLIVR